MKYDKYDKWRPSRRTTLRGAFVLGLAAALRLALAEDAGDPRAGAGPKPALDDPKPAAPNRLAGAPASYRLYPSTHVAGYGVPNAAPLAVPVRAAAHETLRLPARSGDRMMALTFDDGPHPTQTPAILRILRRYDTRATFFVIGENIPWNSDVLKAVVDDGHVIGNHSYTHPQLNLIDTARVHRELARTSDLIEQTVGAPPRLARAPYGMWDDRGLRICAALGMEPFQWNIDTNDWAEPGTHAITTAVLRGAQPHSIVLAHDGGGNRWQTVTALEYYLPRLIDQGYTLVQPA
ncbi:polysaccharide deacetylase family protein [Streptomyces sp. NPDC051940]|uniref:polysaccharide deacetylase family protein n=1 Tax=Streptomyces sp. NPDC051940 TaxID=3155675 RepID=UPI0034365876